MKTKYYNRFLLPIVIYVITYSVIVTIVWFTNDHEIRAFTGYIVGFLGMPTNLLFYYLIDYLDPYSYIIGGISSAIQFGLLLLIINWRVNKSDEKDNENEQIFNDLKNHFNK